MRPPRLAEAPQQRVIRGLKKNHRGIELLLERADDHRQFAQLLTLADIGNQGGLFYLRRLLHQIGKARNQADRQVVYTVIAQIFKSLQRGGLPRSGHAGNYRQMGSTLAPSGFYATPALGFPRSRHRRDTTMKRFMSPHGWRLQ